MEPKPDPTAGDVFAASVLAGLSPADQARLAAACRATAARLIAAAAAINTADLLPPAQRRAARRGGIDPTRN